MKKILFALCALLCTIVHVNAQNTLIATLSHEGNITAFYGARALIEAHAAASDGDVISLSPGLFNASYINKAITLRGSGLDNDASTGRQATYISGDFDIYKPKNSTEPIIIEGVYCVNNINICGDSLKVQFTKSRFNKIDYKSTNEKSKELTFINCKITDGLTLFHTSCTCINSMINYVSTANNTRCDFSNCYLHFLNNTENCLFNNCLIHYGSKVSLSSSNIVNNCLFSGYNNLLKYTQGDNNTYIENLSDIFVADTYNPIVTDIATYVLTDDAKAKYLGNDGTEVGIYGGMIPFSSTPSSPQISKFKIAEKSTADGKLSIDITISMPK